MRIHDDISGCVVGQFSKLKHVQSPNFRSFRREFRGKLERVFLVPADTFDNVKGRFPIGFFVWRLGNCQSDMFTSATADVYDAKGRFSGMKNVFSYDSDRFVIEWLRQFYDRRGERIGYLRMVGTDVQNSSGVFIASCLSPNDFKKRTYTVITAKNIVAMCIYVAIRHVVEATWLNDRDQFLWPQDAWLGDSTFQADCLVHALFDNVVKSVDGVNYWIPFTEKEVNAQGLFKSHFMSDFLAGKVKDRETIQGDFFAEAAVVEKKSFVFSVEAQKVMDAGRELWRYYHAQPNANPNASFYDIRLHFQGSTTDAKGKVRMNNESSDEKYVALIANLRAAMKNLAKRIEPKVYEYGFLKG